jgi:hypothetical protein
MGSALNHTRTARKNPRRAVNRSSPKAEVTGSNPVGCAKHRQQKSPKLA